MIPLASSPGRLAENVMHFGRVLRHAGMPVGTDRVMTALQALQVAGLESRADFHAVLSACMVDRAEHRELFDQAFHLFWRDPDLEGRMRALLLPKVKAQGGPSPVQENRRLASALFPNPPQTPPEEPEKEELELEATLSWTQREVLRQADFETMTAEEWRAAQKLLARLALVFEALPTRRMQRASHRAAFDWRATMAAMARHGGELRDLHWRGAAQPAGAAGAAGRHLGLDEPLFAHAAALRACAGPCRRAGREFRLRHPADAHDPAAEEPRPRPRGGASGARRAGLVRRHAHHRQALHEFNRRWARRTLPGQATVLLITDGLEHGDSAALAFEIERLHKSCRRLIWLNPLLRFDGFEPRAGGVKAMLPHVDRFLPVHNLASLEQLAEVLARPAAAR